MRWVSDRRAAHGRGLLRRLQQQHRRASRIRRVPIAQIPGTRQGVESHRLDLGNAPRPPRIDVCHVRARVRCHLGAAAGLLVGESTFERCE